MIVFKSINNLFDSIEYYNKIVNCSDDVVLDFKKTTFIRNHCLSIVGLALEIKKDYKIKIIEPKDDKIRNDLNNIGLLSMYSKCTKGIDTKNRMIRYTNIRDENDEYYEFYSYFVNQLNSNIGNLSSELANKIMQKIYEQFSNVFRHSNSEFGFSCTGQLDSKKQEFNFTIVDNGITIKTNVNRYLKTLTQDNKSSFNFKKYNELNGAKTIEWALINNNSTTGSGGFGLSLLKELILKSNGRLEILSNDGYYKIEDRQESSEVLKNKFDGTIVSIGLSTDNSKYYYIAGDKND